MLNFYSRFLVSGLRVLACLVYLTINWELLTIMPNIFFFKNHSGQLNFFVKSTKNAIISMNHEACKFLHAFLEIVSNSASFQFF